MPEQIEIIDEFTAIIRTPIEQVEQVDIRNVLAQIEQFKRERDTLDERIASSQAKVRILNNAGVATPRDEVADIGSAVITP